jgi:hypothetical protein
VLGLVVEPNANGPARILVKRGYPQAISLSADVVVTTARRPAFPLPFRRARFS